MRTIRRGEMESLKLIARYFRARVKNPHDEDKGPRRSRLSSPPITVATRTILRKPAATRRVMLGVGIAAAP